MPKLYWSQHLDCRLQLYWSQHLDCQLQLYWSQHPKCWLQMLLFMWEKVTFLFFFTNEVGTPSADFTVHLLQQVWRDWQKKVARSVLFPPRQPIPAGLRPLARCRCHHPLPSWTTKMQRRQTDATTKWWKESAVDRRSRGCHWRGKRVAAIG